jgi:hypothetical protein
MTVFTAAELACMQAAAETVMMDTCDLLARDETDRKDEYGYPVAEWVEEYSLLACGLDLRASRELLNAETPLYDARLRVPIDTDVSQVDRVRITHRFGEMLSEALLFELIGLPRRGPSGLLLELRYVSNAA